jgi:hypothetical protein
MRTAASVVQCFALMLDGPRLLLIMPVQESAQRELGVILNWQETVLK